MTEEDRLLASVARKLLAPGNEEMYLDFRDYGVIVDGTLYGLTAEEEAAARRAAARTS